MMWIVRLALRRPYTFAVFALLILILGAYSIASMPTDIFPNIDIPVVTVVWNYTGLSAQEMANRIVFNSERGMTTTVNDIEHIESQSLNGIGVIKVFFQPHVNIGQRGCAGHVHQPGTAAPASARNHAAVHHPVQRIQRAGAACSAFPGTGLNEQQLIDLGHEHHPHAAGHRRGRADALSLRRQAAPDPGGYRSRSAAGQRAVAGRRGERDLTRRT